MIPRGISIRSALLIATLVTLLVLLVMAAVVLDASNRLDQQREILRTRTGLLSEYHALQRQLYRSGSYPAQSAVSESLRHLHRLEAMLPPGGATAAGAPPDETWSGLSPDPSTLEHSKRVRSSVNRLMDQMRVPALADSLQRLQVLAELEVLGDLLGQFDEALDRYQENRTRQRRLQLGLSLAVGILLVGILLIVPSVRLTRSFDRIGSFTGHLRKGGIPPPVPVTTEDEFGRIAGDLSAHAAELQKKINYITSLSEEGPVPIYSPAEEDALGRALVVLSETLTRKELEEVTRNREDKKRNWISEGMAQIGDVLRSERENVEELAFRVVQKLVSYMELEMGSLFLTRMEEGPETSAGTGPELKLTATYAFDRRKYNELTLKWGEGLPGTCAREGKPVFLTDIPEEYFEVSSGTGSARPNCLFLVPMLFDDKVVGVIELATIRLLRPFELEFVESIAESIASSLLAVHNNERNSELLKQSQAQAEALKKQETSLRDSMKQLENAQSESQRKEAELTGILQAIDQSTLVAELALNARYTRMNDRFLSLLGMEREQVMGRLYHEFARVDPYTDDYKEFWSKLKAGSTLSNTDKYVLGGGEEIWLRQTFTPIINDEGKVFKILNIAVDITGERRLQEELGSREREITRRSLDLKTLNQAVNTALITCQLDAEGIIMEVNENYTEVTGYGRKELLGRNYRLFLKESEREQFEKIWQEVSKQKVYEGVIRRTRPTGEEAWLVSTFSPVVDEDGVVYKVYFMGLDITEKKLKYQLLEEANQEIERLKGQLKNDEP